MSSDPKEPSHQQTVAVFSARAHDRQYLEHAAANTALKFRWLETKLTPETAPLANGCEIVSAFVHDLLGESVLAQLADFGVMLVALRCAGFNNLDVHAAEQHSITVLRVPAYSPHAVAEHTVGLMLTLNRKFHRAYHRVREGNLSLDNLLGFDMHGKTVGVIGLGKIGQCTAQILAGFGCRVVGHDPYPPKTAQALQLELLSLDELLQQSDIVTLHCPLTPQTHHLVDEDAIAKMKDGVMLINTSRGGLVSAPAAVSALKRGKIGYLGLDVYEEEGDIFFEDLSTKVIQDDVFARLLTFPNVVITAHQAFFTHEALSRIAETTIGNIIGFMQGKVQTENQVQAENVVGREHRKR